MQPQDILDYWFDPEGRKRWFNATPDDIIVAQPAGGGILVRIQQQ